MKKLTLLLVIAVISATVACSKSDAGTPNTPRTEVPGEIRGNWMYGNFSMTEYWDQYPGDYLGNGLEFAFAFTFNADGTYTQYFTASTVVGGVQSYQQSVSNGTVEVDADGKIITTHAHKAHYRRTSGGQVVEERDLTQAELSKNTVYTYTTGVEPSGTQALYLTIVDEDDTDDDEPLTFLRLN